MKSLSTKLGVVIVNGLAIFYYAEIGGVDWKYYGLWKSIFDYRPDSHGAEDYLGLCKEIIKRE